MYGIDKIGMPFWVETKNSTSQPDSRVWHRPETELSTISSTSRLVDLLLKGRKKCDNEFLNRSACSCALPECCLILKTKLSDLASLEARQVNLHMPCPIKHVTLCGYDQGMTVDQRSAQWNSGCKDTLSIDFLKATKQLNDASRIFQAIADSVNIYTTCPGGCLDSFKLLCKGGRCVTPTCADVQQHCQADSEAGKSARLWCPEKCGCDDAFSPLLLNGKKYGCSPACRAKIIVQAAVRPCADMVAGSAELIAYGQALIDYSPRTRADFFVSVGETLRTKGCKAEIFNVYSPQTLCRPSSDTGFKGILAFCPVLCRCKVGELGCPSSCSAAMESPRVSIKMNR